MPATKGVRREQVRQPLSSWSEPLENREHQPFLLTRLRVGDLAAQDNQLLAQYQQLEILRARRPAGEEQQSEHLAEGEGDEADGHPASFAFEISGVRPGQEVDHEVAPFTSGFSRPMC